jgi:transcriptional regulator with XRE-family HTH domain
MRKSIHTPEYAAMRAQLHKARTDAGLSQRDLAARLNVPHSWVAKVENGERRIDLIEFCWFLKECGGNPVAVFRKLVGLPKRASLIG